MIDSRRESVFLKPEQLVPIRNLSLRAKLIVEGTIAGLHKSPYHGFSAEFLEYRPYLSGESARRIDWRKYAKTDRSVVKLFEDETNLSAHLLLDKSASMRLGSGAVTKYAYAQTLAASLAWILIRQRDAVGLAAFDDEVRVFIPPRSANIQLKTILAQLTRIAPDRTTQCGMAIGRIAQGLKRRGLCILISDFFDAPERIIEGLRHLRFKRQDVLLFWIMDPLERRFNEDAPLQLCDLETGQRLFLDGRTASEHFAAGFSAHQRKIERACQDLRIDVEFICTDEPFQRALLRALNKRRRLQ